MKIAFSAVIVLLSGILAAEFFYLRNYLSRFFAFWNIDCSKKKNKIIKYIIIFVIMGLTLTVFSIVGMATIHILAAVAVLDLISFIVSKTTRKKIKVLNAIAVSALPGIILGTSIVLYGIFNMSNIVKTEYDVFTDKELKQDYRIAMVSDIHFGNSVDMEKLHKLVDDISNENPDLLLIVGDITDEGTDKALYSEIFDTLAKTKTQFGSYYVFGNHDKVSREIIEYTGINVLEDEVRVINNDFILAGHKDASFKNKNSRMPINELLENQNMSSFILLMDHQPAQYEENEKACVDLQVSGHTHAGQVFPGGLLTATIGGNDFNYGKYSNNSFQAIVSSGASGWGFNFRTEQHSEFVIINLIEN